MSNDQTGEVTIYKVAVGETGSNQFDHYLITATSFSAAAKKAVAKLDLPLYKNMDIISITAIGELS